HSWAALRHTGHGDLYRDVPCRVGQHGWRGHVRFYGYEWARWWGCHTSPHVWPWRQHQDVLLPLEWCSACRPYLSWTWWCPGEQSKSTDFPTGCANGTVSFLFGDVPGHKRYYGGESHIHSRAVLRNLCGGDLYGHHPCCGQWSRRDRQVQYYRQQWARKHPGQHHLQPWADGSYLFLYLERSVAW